MADEKTSAKKATKSAQKTADSTVYSIETASGSISVKDGNQHEGAVSLCVPNGMPRQQVRLLVQRLLHKSSR